MRHPAPAILAPDRRRQPLAQLDQRTGHIGQADADLAVANYNQTLLSAIHDVADAVQTARTLDAQIATTTQARTAAATAFSNVQQRQRAGLASRLDSLNAQKPVLQLEQQLATLVAARRSASVDLDQALGGGIAIEASISPDAAAQTTASK